MKVLAENIRKLRKERNLTQEELAGFLQVSFQTISKWERRETLPDISMLPVLAGFFDISVDELLGFSKSREQKKRNEILETWEQNNAAGNNIENVQFLRTALKSYPGDYLIMLKLITSLEKCDGSSEEISLYKKEALELSEQILKHCPDYHIRNEVAFNICFSYFRSGNLICNAIEPKSTINTNYKKRWFIEQLSSNKYGELKKYPQFNEIQRRLLHELL